MANLAVKDGNNSTKYLSANGVGTNGDPHLPVQANSAEIRTAVEASATSLAALDNAIAGNEVQVDIVSMPAVSITGTPTVNIGTMPTVVISDGVGPVTVDGAVSITGTPTVNIGTMPTVVISDGAGPVTVDGSVSITGTPTVNIGTMPTVVISDGAGPVTVDGSVSITGTPTVINAAGENHIGEVSSNSAIVDVTLSLDTAAYAAGDVLAETQVVTGALRVNDGTGLLHSISLTDKDDQGAAFDLVFLRANVSLGTENAVPSITDADADNVLGIVSIYAGDFIDLGGVRVATRSNIGLVLKAGAGVTSVWVAAITRGTPTHTASGITLRLGILRD